MAKSITLTAQDTEGAVSKKQIVMALFASVSGWSLDLFDLFLLLYMAPTLGKLFFPATIPTLSLAGVYAAFATSCVVRPLGSMYLAAMLTNTAAKTRCSGDGWCRHYYCPHGIVAHR